MIRIHLAAIFATVPFAHAGETEWPQFRGPTGQGLSSAESVPLQWGADANIRWKVKVPPGWSSPVLSGGRIYLTAAEGEDDISLRALCLDAETGRTLWNAEVFRPDESAARAMHRKNSAASPTPIVEGGRLYVHFGHMGTAALDLNGRILWKQQSLKFQPVHGNGGTPVLVDGMLIFTCDGAKDPFLSGLDAATGAVKWRTPRRSPARKQFSFATPLVIEAGGAKQVIAPGSGLVAAYDPQTGAEKWRVTYGEGYSVVPRPVFAHGLVFVSSGFDRPALLAIRPDGAKGDATSSHVAWSIQKGAPLTGSPLVVGDELYFISDGGIATCADAKTGRVHWSERIGGDNSASPFHAEGRIYFLNESGVTTVVKAGTSFEILARNPVDERTLASCAVADGAIYLRSESHLRRIGGAR